MAIVGIDLGTTNSLVAVMRPEGPETLSNELGEHLTPSAVAVAEDGALLVGRAARDRLVVAPESGRAFFKRDMGTDVKYRFGERTWRPTECSAAVLRELKRVAELRLGGPVEQAVVTVPAYFHEPQRQATIEAATIAGLKVERILNEPTAAALAFGYRRSDEERRLLVFDLGGGTFDVTMLETFEGIIEVRSSGGDSHLGGEDYTDALLDLALAAANLDPLPPERARLRQRAEVAKRALTERDAVEFDAGGTTVRLTRQAFERATAGITARLFPVVQRCLRDAGVVARDLDDVLMVGGASRMPAILALVGEQTSHLPNRTLDPDRVVALGAAVQAARAERSEAVADVVMTDVCPHSLGVEVAKRYGSHLDDGHFTPILDRNVTVPASRVERFSTMHPNQDRIDIRVFQGENRRTAGNTFLGAFSVDGLRSKPDAPHAGDVDIRFSYDANGILEVEATIMHSGVKAARVIESRPGALSPEQVREAVARLQPLKTHPRNLLPNRARLERAYRLFSELTGAARQDLSGRIDAFEGALERGDPQAMGMAAAILDAMLEGAFAEEGESQTSRPESDDSP